MPTLRIEADIVGTSTGFMSTMGFSSYEAAVEAASGPNLLELVLPIQFVRKNTNGTFDVVFIYRDYFTKECRALVTVRHINPDAPPQDPITLTVSNSTTPAGTRVLDIVIPDDLYVIMQGCDWVYYGGGESTDYESFGITQDTDWEGETFYVLAYGFFTSTVSNVRGFISGSLLFDSSDTTPDPYDWGSEYSSMISWGVTPDIFWTNRILCEETPS